MQNFELRLVIAILKLVTWVNRLDIWITIIQKIHNFVEFQPLKVELILRQSFSSETHLDCGVRQVCVCGLLGKNGWHRVGEPWMITFFYLF